MRKWSLQRVLILVSFLQILATALVVGGLSSRTNTHLYNRALSNLQQSYLEQTRTRIRFYLTSTQKSTEIAAAFARRDAASQELTFEKTLVRLWRIAEQFPQVSTLAWATPNGRFIGVNRPSRYIVYTRPSPEKPGVQELVRRRAQPGDWLSGSVISRNPGYQPQARGWYRQAVQQGKAVWSRVNFSIAARRLDATNAVPVYSDGGNLLGVAMTDISLNRLSRELKNISAFPEGTAVLLDQREKIIAASVLDEPYRENRNSLERIDLADSGHPLLTELASFPQAPSSPVTKRLSLASVGNATVIRAPMTGEGRMDNEGLDRPPPLWSILLVLPEDYYQQPLRSTFAQSLLLISLIILFSGAGSVFFTRWLLRPLRSLHRTTRAMSQGRWIVPESTTRQDEIGHLSRTFVNMTTQIRETLRQLRKENQERRKTEEKLSRSLSEKEVLLKEIHHRVKNNMQIIVSLINLEKEGTKHITPEGLNLILEDLSSRISAMASVHEKLYGSTDLTHIQIEEFIPDLVEETNALYSLQAARVQREYRLSPLAITIDKAIPLGLLINEIVSNSIKHAFAPGREGKIEFESYQKDENLHLLIRDSGPGFDWEEARQKESLGMVLIESLAGQLKSQLSISSSDGSRYHLIIPLTPRES